MIETGKTVYEHFTSLNVVDMMEDRSMTPEIYADSP